jgi:hypothetical protein
MIAQGLDMDDDLQGCDGINDTRRGMRPGVVALDAGRKLRRTAAT